MSNKIDGGAIPSPIDERDYTVTAAMEIADVVLPEEYHVSYLPPVANQLAIGRCVAESIACVLECIRYKLYDKHEDFSVSYIYGNRKAGQHEGTGMIPRQALSNTLKDGDVLAKLFEGYWEYEYCKLKFDVEHEKLSPFAEHRMFAYINLSNNVADAKRFILKYDIPIVLTAATAELIGDDRYTGHHAVACTGWKGDEMLFRNSWGENHKGGSINKYLIDEMWGIVPMEIKFSDIDNDRWSAAAIKECVADGIIIGYEDGTFRPEDKPSREEFAIIYQRIKRQVAKMIKEGQA